VGKLEIGDAADFIIAENLVDFNILQTYIDGELVAENGKSLIVGKKQSDQGWTAYPPNYIHPKRTDVVNNFNCSLKSARDFEVAFDGENEIPVIEALDGQLITNKLYFPPKVMDGQIESDIENDVLKIVVINRYHEAPIAKAWIKNFGLKHGAIASSVAHDSHNIIAVGVDDENIAMAVNLLVQHHGGISAIRNCPVPKELQPRYKGLNMDEQKAFFEDYFTGGQSLPLPVAGLMSDIDGYKVAESYTAIDKIAKQLGADLTAPFMTLSFMALLVIPHLKLSDKGLFDGDGFKFI
jgi:adenine deaminase